MCEIMLKICEYFEVKVIVFFVELNDVDYFINVVWEENMVGYIWIGFDVFVWFYLVLCNNKEILKYWINIEFNLKVYEFFRDYFENII